MDLKLQQKYKGSLDHFHNSSSILTETYNDIVTKIKANVIAAKKSNDNWKVFQELAKDYKANFETLLKAKQESPDLSKFVTHQIDYGLLLGSRNREMSQFENQINEFLENLEIEKLDQLLVSQNERNIKTRDEQLIKINDLKENIRNNPMYVQEKLDLMKKQNKNAKKK